MGFNRIGLCPNKLYSLGTGTWQNRLNKEDEKGVVYTESPTPISQEINMCTELKQHNYKQTKINHYYHNNESHLKQILNVHYVYGIVVWHVKKTLVLDIRVSVSFLVCT